MKIPTFVTAVAACAALASTSTSADAQQRRHDPRTTHTQHRPPVMQHQVHRPPVVHHQPHVVRPPVVTYRAPNHNSVRVHDSVPTQYLRTRYVQPRTVAVGPQYRQPGYAPRRVANYGPRYNYGPQYRPQPGYNYGGPAAAVRYGLPGVGAGYGAGYGVARPGYGVGYGARPAPIYGPAAVCPDVGVPVATAYGHGAVQTESGYGREQYQRQQVRIETGRERVAPPIPPPASPVVIERVRQLYDNF